MVYTLHIPSENNLYLSSNGKVLLCTVTFTRMLHLLSKCGKGIYKRYFVSQPKYLREHVTSLPPLWVLPLAVRTGNSHIHPSSLAWNYNCIKWLIRFQKQVFNCNFISIDSTFFLSKVVGINIKWLQHSTSPLSQITGNWYESSNCYGGGWWGSDYPPFCMSYCYRCFNINKLVRNLYYCFANETCNFKRSLFKCQIGLVNEVNQ